MSMSLQQQTDEPARTGTDIFCELNLFVSREFEMTGRINVQRLRTNSERLGYKGPARIGFLDEA